MLFSSYGFAFMAAAFINFTNVAAVAPTDEYTDADRGQSGYLPNHNMDPAVVDSSQFGQLWKVPFNAKEQFYAKPLTYTPLAGGPQLLFLASSQNWIRTLDAKTGNILNTRQVHTPFLQSDIGCTDIANTIGIIGTPVIDPGSDIVYFYSKTYIPNYRTAGNTGTYNGVYYFHGVNVNTLQDVPGYPILVDGSTSDNAPSKYFIGGTVLQRPSLTQIGNVVYGAFGGHCDLFNYTGLVIGIDVNQKKVVTSFATETGPLVPQTNVWNQNGGGGQGGIWQSGMGLSTDGARLFFVSGNGVGHQNSGPPASGSTPLNTLGEACANLQVGAGGILSLTDYFQPYDYQNLDGGDQDLGSSGLALLDPGTFKGTGVSRMGVTAGKNGKIYILNADNLGGYRLGPGQTDGIIQTLVTNKAVFGGCGSYPLEGGYIYSTPVGYPTYVYKLGFTGSGVPQFNPAGQSRENSAGRVGVGIPTVTTNQGRAGTAILWMTDPDAGLRAWYAVPGADGFLKTINLPQVNGLNKFQRPTFGDSRLYVTDPNGVLYCLGSPVNLPLNCTSPVSFGTVALGSQSTQTITCKANIAITSINGATVGDAHFQVNNSSLPQGPVAAGTVFSFPVTWNLKDTSVSNAQNASFGSTTPGVKSTALTLLTTNAVTGYSTQFPISLTGTEVSQNAYLSLAPINVDYGGVVILPNQTPPTISLPFVIANAGSSPMTILGYAYTSDELDNADITFTNTTFAGDGTADLGHGFTSSNLPPVNTVIQPNQQVSVSSTFTPVDGIGSYQSYFNVWTDGGKAYTLLEGSASAAPVANFSISTSEGGWLPQSNLLMDFGKVAPGSSSSRQIRICNVGGSVLEISKSKPPNGVIRASAPGIDLHESQQIPVGNCAYGTVLFNAPTEDPNVPDQVVTNTWTLNTNDLNFGVHEVQITGTIVDVMVGPTNSTGNPVYTYLGCYQDGQAGKLLPAQQWSDANNNNGRCQTACNTGKYIFAGTEYQTECYCGNTPPPSQYLNADNTMCTFACSGDGSQHCGGVNGFISIYYDATRYTPGSSSTTTPPNTGPGTTPGDPVTVAQVANYNYIGCYSEATAGRALSGKAVAAPTTGGTVESCQAACSAYTYFGVEYSNECYCGNTINAGSVAQTSTSPATNGCSMLCGGNQTEYCGGPNRLNMYSVNGSLPVPTSSAAGPTSTPTGGPVVVQSAGAYSYMGCYTEATAGRALSGLENPESGAGNTVEACAAACSKYTYFGVEYGSECYCGNSFGAGSVVATGGGDPNANGCSMTCAGNATEYCGGPNRLNAYQLNSTAVTSSSSGTASGSATATTSATSTTSAAPTPTGPIVVQTVGQFAFQGCYSEATGQRALTGLASANDSMTIELCASTCASFTWFGAEYGRECFCGSSPNAGSALVANQADCNMVCPGNTTEYCGAGNRLQMYKLSPPMANVLIANSSTSANSSASAASASITTASGSSIATSSGSSTAGPSSLVASSTSPSSSAISSPTGPIVVPGNVNFTYMACMVEPTGSRALSNMVVANNTMTVEACLSSCYNYAYAGLEYGQECWCGSTLNSATVNATLQSDCSMTCAGNSSEICGNGNRLTMYKLKPAAVAKDNSSLVTTATTFSSGSTTAIPTSSATSSSEITSQSSSSSSSASPSSTSSSSGASSVSLSSFASSSSASSSGSSSSSSVPTSSSASSTPSSASSVASSSSTSGPSATTSSSSPVSSSASSSASGSSTTLVTSTTSTTSSTTLVPTPGQTIGSWVYLGCANETNPRALSGASYTNTTGMTVEACQQFCSNGNNNYGLAGVEYASQCYCGNALQSYSALGFTGCNKPCTGNSSEICGGSSRLSVYNSTTYIPPTTVKQVGSYVSKGCYAEVTNGRLLGGASYSNSTGMTVETCVGFCKTANANYAGLEFGKQCFCGTSLPSTATTLDASQCNMVCTGNKREFCGAAAKLNIYFNDPSSLNPDGTPANMNAQNSATVSAASAPTSTG